MWLPRFIVPVEYGIWLVASLFSFPIDVATLAPVLCLMIPPLLCILLNSSIYRRSVEGIVTTASSFESASVIPVIRVSMNSSGGW